MTLDVLIFLLPVRIKLKSLAKCAVTTYCQLSGLNIEICCLFWCLFWKLGAAARGARRVGSFWGLLGYISSNRCSGFRWSVRNLWRLLGCGSIWSLPWSSHGILYVFVLSSLCACHQISLFYKDISHMGLGAHPTPVWPHPNPAGYICNDSTQIRSRSEILRVRTSTYNYRVEQNLIHNREKLN